MGTAFATLNCFLILLVTEMFGFTDLMHTVLLLIQVDGSTPSDQIMKSLMFWKLLHVKLLHSVLRNKHGSSPHSAGSSSMKGFISWRWSSSNPLTSHLLEDPSPGLLLFFYFICININDSTNFFFFYNIRNPSRNGHQYYQED